MNNTKPLCLRLEDAKTEIARVINKQRENGIPFYLLEPILKDYYTQVVNGKNNEVETMRKEYESAEKEEQTSNNSSKNKDVEKKEE